MLLSHSGVSESSPSSKDREILLFRAYPGDMSALKEGTAVGVEGICHHPDKGLALSMHVKGRGRQVAYLQTIFRSVRV